ncbi:MAG: DUF4131 domain-containing protein, partial [candidate division Zixibacteria bacterium]|nr:DUF4131 domain-containing protein [candidate division Zixibacteria bacterium]
MNQIFGRAPALWVAVAFALGIILADNIKVSSILLLTILLLLVVLNLVWLRQTRRWTDALLLLTILGVGLWRYEISTSDFPWNHISNLTNLDQKITLTGRISEDPDVRDDRTYLTVSSRTSIWRGKEFETSGKFLIKIKKPSHKFNYGDKISVRAYLFSPQNRRNPG